MPWNSFINANNVSHLTEIEIEHHWLMVFTFLQYFTDYKLTLKHDNGTHVPSIYKEYFLSYLGFAAQVPNVLFNLFNIFFQFGYVPITPRLLTNSPIF